MSAVPEALLKDTKKLVKELVADLYARYDHDPESKAKIDAEWQRALAAGRTGLKEADWREGYLNQVAVAWVLAGVFVRFCEDNDLVRDPHLGGPGNRANVAADHRAKYLREHPAHDDRHWLTEVFRRYAALPATGEVFGEHNALWQLDLSADGARRAVEFWRERTDDGTAIRHDFTDPAWDTRFLGDLYQDLSDHAKKTYALLQTPEFVEEFILARTLDPAIDTFGLAEVRMIDPTCGSGHFLLGAFADLFARWRQREPGENPRVHAQRALDAIHGVDLNPHAAAIARFRLLVAALKAGQSTTLADAPSYRVQVAVGDALLHGDPPGRGLLDDSQHPTLQHNYATEDGVLARRFLNERYHAVVGNPPYITVKDPALRDLYRERYDTCRGKYSLGVPFTEQFFHLAVHALDSSQCGFVGMITANSFMKREFGKDLIEKWFPTADLTHVIDTSGAYIPGHGTPTVILLGRNRKPASPFVRAVMGIRGEPSRPADPAKGEVWSSILGLLDQPGGESPFVSVVDLERARLHSHPWSIGGGGAAELKEQFDRAGMPLKNAVDLVGVFGMSNADDTLLADEGTLARRGVEHLARRPLVVGDIIRDWRVAAGVDAVFPYDADGLIDIEELPGTARFLWPCRTVLYERATFGGATYRTEGRAWWEWHQVTLDRLLTPLSIVFAFVATHNHFVLDRGGKVFNRSAPVIKLPAGASEDAHLELVGVLNSSTACFWMKQVFHNKGDSTDRSGARVTGVEAWIDSFEHDGTKLQQFPLPHGSALNNARALDDLAQKLAATAPAAIAERDTPTAEHLTGAHCAYDQLRARMIALQEELDWHVYSLYGLIDEPLTLPLDQVPEVALGERAFEIVLARQVAAGDEETSWFARHGSTPITEIPAHWPAAYRALVERRIELIEADRSIALIERPEHKRRWNTEPWAKQEAKALRTWLLDRIEARPEWRTPQLRTAAQLADLLGRDTDFVTVARLYANDPAVDLATLVSELTTAEAVPYLAALRYTPDGLRKHAEWLRTWELQRAEDRGEDVGPIPVPPKYTSKDFRGHAWDHRGKLDVPKERFISYPLAERGTDTSPVLGWAGWDHLARARALAHSPRGSWPRSATAQRRKRSRRSSPASPSSCPGCCSGTTSPPATPKPTEPVTASPRSSSRRPARSASPPTTSLRGRHPPPRAGAGSKHDLPPPRVLEGRAMTRLAELIDIPEQVHESDLVINLQSGLHDPQRTVDQYVVTPQLAKAFDQAMHLVVSAIDDGRSKGTYLHGSFGSGKSHFMAILSLLLARNPVARRIPELGEVIAHYDAPLEGKKLVLVPYHVVGAETLEQVILGGYVAYVKELRPPVPLPAVYVTDTLLTDAQRLRVQLGDEQFFALLGTDSAADDPWGDLASGWDAARFDVAAAASPGDAEHDALVNALLSTVFAGYTNVAAAQGTGFVPLEDGLAAISRHAKDVLGVDAVVLFLDELILWLMARMADQAFVTKEGSKISKLIETDHTRRPAPIISFIARQRDLREIVGDAIPGADQLRFADVLKYWDSRFGTITLEDRNLAAIAERRVLKPKSEAARQELARGFERSLAELDAAGGRDTLLTQTADLDEFRKLYPFNPALIEALVALSAALQRERTAIKVMVQLLSDHRDTIEVGDLVPLGDLFDVLAKGVDPMVPAMRDQFDTATRLWRTKFEPVLDREFGDPASADHLAAARLVKSLLLAALVPDVAPLRNLTVSRLVALNHGTIKAFIPGTERDEALALVNRWKAEIGELRVGDDPNDPTVAVQLSSVDIGPILDQARAEDRDGVRQRKIRELLVEAISVDRADSLQPTIDVVWRGFARKVDVMFANVRDTVTHPDATLRPDNELKLIVDYPFDPGHNQQDDIARIEGYVETNQPTNTVCWLPTFFTEGMLRHLGDLVVMDHVLSGDRFLGYAQHLSAVDRESARASLLSQRGAKRDTVLRALRQAYGIEPATSGMVLTGDGAGAKFLTLNPAVTVRPPVAASLTDAARHLAAQAFGALYPGHPEIEGRVSTGDLRTVLAQVTKANALPDRRLENVDPAARKLLTNIAQPLQLGTMYQAHFVASEHWRHQFERKVGGAGAKVTVGQLRALLDDPKPAGMPKPLGDLVIAAFAAQTNRKVVAGGRVIPPDIGTLDDVYELLTSHVPTQEVWDRAVANAQAIFGVAGLSPLPSAAALGELAQQVQTALGPHAATSIASYAAQLRTALATRHITGEPPRLRNAHAAKELLDEITAAGERVAEVLAEFTPPTSAQALGRSFVRAGNLAGLLADTNWALIESATGVGGRYAADANRIAEALGEALRDDEVATPLEPRLQEAERAATELLAQVAHDQGRGTPPEPSEPHEPPVAVVNDDVPAAVRDAIRFAENLAAELGYRIEVTVTKVDQ